MTDEQFKKLPSWAKNRISKLEADYEALRKRCAVIEGECKSSVALSFGFKDERPVPNTTRVKFTLANGQIVTVGFGGSTFDRNYLSVRKESGSTYDLLCVVPRVSNEVYIAVLEEPEEVQP